EKTFNHSERLERCWIRGFIGPPFSKMYIRLSPLMNSARENKWPSPIGMRCPNNLLFSVRFMRFGVGVPQVIMMTKGVISTTRPWGPYFGYIGLCIMLLWLIIMGKKKLRKKALVTRLEKLCLKVYENSKLYEEKLKYYMTRKHAY
ncbi:hypothetical protein CR513_23391, partial [Mucuna pruriens]